MRKKNSILACLFIITGLMIISAVSAEIIISQPSTMYNLGNELSSDIKIDSLKSGYMDIYLICNSQSTNIYHNVPDSTTLTIKRKLIPLYIENLTGNCHIQASYNGESAESQDFKISNLIEVNIANAELKTEAGKSIVLKGSAYRENNEMVGQLSPGFVEMKITLNDNNSDIVSSQIVKDSQFTINLSIPETTRKGNYNARIFVYDIDENGNTLNKGEVQTQISISQKPAKINIATDKTSIDPGENITLIPFISDAAGEQYNGEVLIRVEDPAGKVLFEGYVPANEELRIETQTNYVPGEVRIRAQAGLILGEKYITINQLEKLNLIIENNTLEVTNMGNIAYHKIIEVKIGEEKVLKQIDLELGESKDYQLMAPDGSYQVSVDDGQHSNYSTSGVALTGAAIGITDIKGVSSLLVKYPVIWIFLLVVIIALIWVIYQKRKTKNEFLMPTERTPFKGREFKVKKEEAREDKRGLVMIPKAKLIPMREISLKGDVTSAEPTSSLQGHKQNAGVIAIRLKNSLKGIGEDNISKSLEYAYKKKGVSCTLGNYIIILFSPLLTRTFKNEETAVKVALDIDEFLKEHNRKFRNNRIEYGIGVSSGDIINKVENGVLKYSAIDKTIPSAKKVAEAANNEVFLSAEIRSKVANSVKVEKVEMPDIKIDAFRVKRVVNNEESQKFIQGFMRRN